MHGSIYKPPLAHRFPENIGISHFQNPLPITITQKEMWNSQKPEVISKSEEIQFRLRSYI